MHDAGKLAVETGLSESNSGSRNAAPLAPRRRREDWPSRVRRIKASQYLLEVHGVTIAAATLAKLAVTGGGPEYELWGRFPYYPTQLLDRWAEARLSRRRSTSDRDGDPYRKLDNAIATQSTSSVPTSVVEADLIAARNRSDRPRHSGRDVNIVESTGAEVAKDGVAPRSVVDPLRRDLPAVSKSRCRKTLPSSILSLAKDTITRT